MHNAASPHHVTFSTLSYYLLSCKSKHSPQTLCSSTRNLYASLRTDVVVSQPCKTVTTSYVYGLNVFYLMSHIYIKWNLFLPFGKLYMQIVKTAVEVSSESVYWPRNTYNRLN
jgi:hypothetical protein